MDYWIETVLAKKASHLERLKVHRLTNEALHVR
jgi:hypothetical protein